MPCKPVSLCSSLLQRHKRNKERKRNGTTAYSTQSVVESKDQSRLSDDEDGKWAPAPVSNAQREILRATALVKKDKITCQDHLPLFEYAYSQFVSVYPRYNETHVLDSLREQEYSHLGELACFDYCGFGLFTQSQLDGIDEDEGASSSFALTEVSANLWSHALFGCASKGTMEEGVRTRIMEFLNIPESEYSMVFTASRGATFKLLADAYPWGLNNRLITMYDHESESVWWMEERASECGANVYRARFRWPSLRVCASDLKRELIIGSNKKGKSKIKQYQDHEHADMPNTSRLSVSSWFERVSNQQQNQHQRREPKKGLFVFPVQSRISGAKYSYQWMSHAKRNNWHVLLDASALGPKDMDSLGLSFFRPDFITASFYRLFGGDPSGFSCLLIKNTVAESIQDPNGAPVAGMVRIVPTSTNWNVNSSFTSERSEIGNVSRVRSTMSTFSRPMPTLDDTDISRSSVSEENYNSASEQIEIGSTSSIPQSPAFVNCESGKRSSDDGYQSLFNTAHSTPIPLDVFSSDLLDHSLQSSVMFNDADVFRQNIKDFIPSSSHLDGDLAGREEHHASKDKQNSSRFMENNPLFKWQTVDQGSSISESGKLKGNHSKVGKNNVETSDKGSNREGGKNVSEITPFEDISVDPFSKSFKQDSKIDSRTLSGVKTSSGKTGLVKGLSWRQKDSVLSRETEGGFRLLGDRNADPFSRMRVFSTSYGDDSFPSRSIGSGVHSNWSFERSIGVTSEEEQVSEPKLVFRSLDHANMLGLNRTSFRLLSLVNWLVSSLQRLQFAETAAPLVRIYGPEVRYDRGASVAFNVFDRHGTLIHPDVVRLLADQVNVSLGMGFLRSVYVNGKLVDQYLPGIPESGVSSSSSKFPSGIGVVTAALGLISDFRDVYKLWSFVGQFLDSNSVARKLSLLQSSSNENEY